MKWQSDTVLANCHNVAPCAGAWIEILMPNVNRYDCYVSPPARGRGLKSHGRVLYHQPQRVAPCAGAWIQISKLC